MARRKSGGITIGFFGTGEMDVDTAMTLIDEHLHAHGDDPLQFMFVITSDEFSDTLGELVQLAVNSEIPFQAVTSPNDKARRAFSDALGAASKTHSVEDPVSFLQTTLSESPGGRLFLLWDKDREDEMQEIATTFLEAGVPTYDLSDALTEIGFPEEAEAEAEPEPEDEDEAEPVAAGAQVYSRSELQKLGRSELRDIAHSLGIQPRRASAEMIMDILEAQGEPQGMAEEPEPEPASHPGNITVMPDRKPSMEQVWYLEKFEKALDQFTDRLLGGLEQVLSRFQAQPEPEPEAPTPRRLRRS